MPIDQKIDHLCHLGNNHDLALNRYAFDPRHLLGFAAHLPREGEGASCNEAGGAEAEPNRVPLSGPQPPDRPASHLGNESGGIGAKSLGHRHQTSVAGITDGDEHVAHESVAADPLDRRA